MVVEEVYISLALFIYMEGGGATIYHSPPFFFFYPSSSSSSFVSFVLGQARSWGESVRGLLDADGTGWFYTYRALLSFWWRRRYWSGSELQGEICARRRKYMAYKREEFDFSPIYRIVFLLSSAIGASFFCFQVSSSSLNYQSKNKWALFLFLYVHQYREFTWITRNAKEGLNHVWTL